MSTIITISPTRSPIMFCTVPSPCLSVNTSKGPVPLNSAPAPEDRRSRLLQYFLSCPLGFVGSGARSGARALALLAAFLAATGALLRASFGLVHELFSGAFNGSVQHGRFRVLFEPEVHE